MDIENARKIVDEADKVIVEAFIKRMKATYEIGAEKARLGLPVLDAEREMKVIASRSAMADTEGDRAAIEELYHAIMAISKEQQRAFLPKEENALPQGSEAVYMGTVGSYGEEAAVQLFGEDSVASVKSFSDVFEAVQNGGAKYGVVPVENSSTGSILEVYDLLHKAGLYITHEAYVRVSHCLLAPKGATLDTITEVMSHEQALFQSREFLAEHKEWKQTKISNTAVAAKKVATENNPHKAALASGRCAKIYDLDILKSETNFGAKNSTRFVAVSKTPNEKGGNKCSVAFELTHSSGTLYQALRVFSERGLNLLKIESRPVVDDIGKYIFFLDFSGDPNEENTKSAIESLKQIAHNYRFLGVYPAASL